MLNQLRDGWNKSGAILKGMIQVALDTSFLISFADPQRPNHQVAVDYFRHCIANRIPMWISTIAAGEFHVRQSFTDLPLHNFHILPFNLPHALKAGELFNRLNSTPSSAQGDSRRIIINDLKLIAQALEDRIPIILTEDETTLARLVTRIASPGTQNLRVLLLKSGFSPSRLLDTNQDELPLTG